MRLSRLDILRVHQNNIHFGLRFDCHLCDKLFRYKGDLQKHFIAVHDYWGIVEESAARYHPEFATHPITAKINKKALSPQSLMVAPVSNMENSITRRNLHVTFGKYS